MQNNYDKIRINSNKLTSQKAQALVEEICDRLNLHNYFGIFSMAVDEAIEMIYNNSHLNEKFEVDFSFEQCVNGVCFNFAGNEPLFSQTNEIINLLSNEYNVLDDGKILEMVFFVNGIDQSELKTRQEKFKIFFSQKTIVKQEEK